ncbi:MAG: hypothetical protein KA757_10570, partial [Vogesella sp.]|nr:hypothetical protein [Vogesella sp.]
LLYTAKADKGVGGRVFLAHHVLPDSSAWRNVVSFFIRLTSIKTEVKRDGLRQPAGLSPCLCVQVSINLIAPFNKTNYLDMLFRKRNKHRSQAKTAGTFSVHAIRIY